MRVVEVCCEAEEWDDGCELVQDEKGGYVRERGVGEGGRVSAQELWEPAIEALDAGLRGGRGSGLGGISSCARGRFLDGTEWRPGDNSTEHVALS